MKPTAPGFLLHPLNHSLMRGVSLALAALLSLALGACVEDDTEEPDTSFLYPPGDTDYHPDDADVGTGDADNDADADAGEDAEDADADADTGDTDASRLVQINVELEPSDLAYLHQNPDSKREVPATITVDGVVYTGGEFELHGGFARTRPKLSYRLKFSKKNPLETTLFGEDPEMHRRLVLQASWVDPAWLRNCLSFDLVRRLGGIAPRCSHVELSLNGRYQGFYLVLERIDDVFLERNGLNPNGLLLKADNHSADWGQRANPMDGYELHVNKDAPTHQLGVLRQALATTPATLEDFEREVEPLLSLEDFMTWQMAHTIADNRDTFTKNYYLHYDLENPGSPFRVISWDADATWGMNWDGVRVDSAEQTRFWGSDKFSPRLFSIAAYRDAYLARYAAEVDALLDEDWLDARINHYADRIARAAQRDLQAWERDVDWSEELRWLRDSVDTRLGVMSEALGD